MTRETRGDSKGDAGSARQDGLLPFPTARRAGPLLRPRRPPRRHVAHREGLPERGWPQQGDRAGAQDDLEDFLKESLALPVDPFSFLDHPATSETAAPRLEGFERELFQRLQRLGYEVLPTARSPFDALSKRELTTFLTGIGGAESALDRKAEVVSNISRVVEKDSVMFVVRRAVRTSIRGVPVIGREELRRAKDSDAVEEMISERKG